MVTPTEVEEKKLIKEKQLIKDKVSSKEVLMDHIRTENIRNIAIVAHVDHGKTTLVDAMIRELGGINIAKDERIMDSDSTEKERGITIMNSVTTLHYRHAPTVEGYFFNLIDTPGHKEFSGQVQSVMSNIEAVIIVVDALEGIQVQTQFVISQAVKNNKLIIVVVNKIDRIEYDQRKERCEQTSDEVCMHFIQLGITDIGKIPVLFGSGRTGFVYKDLDKAVEVSNGSQQGDLTDLFDTIVEHIGHPAHEPNENGRMLVSYVKPNKHLKPCLIGRIKGAGFSVGDAIFCKKNGKTLESKKILRMVKFKNGFIEVPIQKAVCGDIVGMYASFNHCEVLMSILSKESDEEVVGPYIDPAVISVKIKARRDKSFDGPMTSFEVLKNSLTNTANTDVGIQVDTSTPGVVQVSGRGSLQLSILFDKMMKAGNSFTMSSTNIETITENGVEKEPIEEITILVKHEYLNQVMGGIQARKAIIQDTEMLNHDMARVIAHISSRNTMGYSRELEKLTGGAGSINRRIIKYEPIDHSSNQSRRTGVLISTSTGTASAYAMNKKSNRGTFFVNPDKKVYKGQIVGISNSKDNVLLNLVEKKKLTNMRTQSKDQKIPLPKSTDMSLDQAMQFITEKERLELIGEKLELSGSGYYIIS